jgi:integrase
MANLTDISVRKLSPPVKGQQLHVDGTIPGLFLRISPGGTRTFVLVFGQRRQWQSIGRYPIISLAQARMKAKEILAQRTLGLHQPKTMRFEAAYELFKSEHCTGKRERTSRDYQRMIDVHFLSRLKHDRLSDITYETVIGIADKLADRPSEQAHALSVARTFFRWCARPPRRYIAHSPLEGLQLSLAKPRRRVLTDAELVKIWNAAEVQSYPYGAVVQLLILTGQRRGEIAALQRSWLNGFEKTIMLPQCLTKNGVKHTFPYGQMVARVLKSIPIRDGVDLLFPSRFGDDRPLSGWSKYKSEMNDGVPGWTLHDLRRTFATRLAQLRVAPHIIERLLNHKFGSIANKTEGMVTDVAEIYNLHRYLPEMREAIEKWENHHASLLASGSPQIRAA